MNLRELIFVLPDDRRATGGTIYNLHLIAALRRRNVSCLILSPGAALAQAAQQPGRLVWTDSLFLARASEVIKVVDAARLFWIVHYFPSLMPDFNAESRAQARRQEAQAFRRCRGVLVTSRYAADMLTELGFSDLPALIVPPALRSEPMPAAAVARRSHALMVANLVPGKGVLEFLTELAARNLPGDRFDLVLAGREDLDPVYAARCLDLITRHPALRERVHYIGELGTSELYSQYARSNLFISASRMESFGMALAEARAFGLPVLALRGGNVVQHVRPGETGFLFDSLPELVERFLALVRSPEQLVPLREGALRFRPRERYTWDDAADEFLRQLNALHKPRPRPGLSSYLNGGRL